MQPEVPFNPQQVAGQPDPAAMQAFQSVAPHPSGALLQPVDPNALKALKPHRSIGGLIAIVLLSIGLLGALGFSGWAFATRQDYKDNSDKKSAAAVEVALGEQKIKLDAEYLEKDKQPYDTFSGRQEAGSIVLKYPRTWSAYVVEDSNGANPINGYFHPGFVPNVSGIDTAFALRIEVTNTKYAEVVKQFEGQIKQGALTLSPYTFPNVAGQLGSKLVGKIVPGRENVQGTMVIMPLRDKTLKVWTESNSVFAKDFNDAVLANLTFVP